MENSKQIDAGWSVPNDLNAFTGMPVTFPS